MGRWGDWEIGRKTERESFTGRRTGKNGPEKRTGKDGLGKAARRNGSGETLNREKRSIGRNAQSGEMLRKSDSEKARRQKILCPAESGQHRSGRRNE